MKKLKTTKNISEETLVLDPDLIDLTIIPPPMTPDEVCILARKFKLSTIRFSAKIQTMYFEI